MLDFSVRKSRNGMGLFSNSNFKKGDIVMEAMGKPAMAEELPNYPEMFGEYSLQIGENMYLGADGGIDDYINHSCDPNCGIYENNGTFYLKAIKDISGDEEITFDYSTDVKDGWEMECDCGKKRCRGIIGNFSSIPKETRERYIRLGVVPKFVLDSN
ncbi:MAG: SET domain-containing protein-lysine N-methyltransferase [Candidatus Aenigmarchaeota archaeon]|nr:SET domain-containing protein-lysine N-methyltransferase [Candidatus Aenigmarchaeota archaeon]